MAELFRRAGERSGELGSQARELRKELRGTEEKLQRLYEAVADGTLLRTGSLMNTASRLEQRRDELVRLVRFADRERHVPVHVLTPQNLDRFATAVREAMRNRESGFRKAYIRRFVERVEVDDNEICFRGSHAALAKGIAVRPAEALGRVPSFVPEWWARQDSNLRQHRYERRVLTS
jgi:hypothetical protein